jgi:hypothetical protein
MRTPYQPLLALAMLLALSLTVRAQTELQQSLKDLDIAPHWIYDDLPKALAQARAEGKPVLVVLRCVPCPPGKKLDAQVMQPDRELEELEKKFVCVRVVHNKGLDLKLFQFDYDQSWCAMFLNADQTIYGRYGTRADRGPQSDAYLTLPSFRKAMERALELHRGYPGNKAQLEGKLGKEPDYPVAEKIPGLQDRAKGAVTRQTCIHCHMVREYQLRAKWEQKRLSPEDLWVYPLPNNMGLRMDINDGLLVKAVTPDSPAARAGLMPGDELVTLGGQRLLSLADIQWVLHTAPAETRLPVTLRRGGQAVEKTIALGGNWKESDLSWRASSWYGLRQGFKTTPLSGEEKRKRDLAADQMALMVEGMFSPRTAPLKDAGIQLKDVIVAVDGKTNLMNETQFLVYLRLAHPPGDKATFTVLRGKERKDVVVPMW